ncbi:MAG: AAA family ATPase, partial [Chloroflexi bacterium]|nr:AAA family ATPase [Chloroflexota bacterium]
GTNSELKDALAKFGQVSGLFNSIEVKRKGQKESDPFQIVVKTIGPTINLVDVGYGVSQVLPIVVDVLQNPSGTTFLLQQPEVHLHPKAQAELGSFLATLARDQNKRFIIETHSDYLLDRIRMDVRDRKSISADDVLILYFEKTPSGVEISEMGVDDFGNIRESPPAYRRFFLEEERRMLGA